MSSEEFKAVVLCNELDLNSIAAHFGINRKWKWEDSLVLQEEALKGIIKETQGRRVRLFHFGSVVFINCAHHEMTDLINYLRTIDKRIITKDPFKYMDDYKIEIDASQEPMVKNDYMLAAAEADYHREIVSTILAKSVALDRIETNIDTLLDDVEVTVERLHEGNLVASDEKLAKISARILGFKLNTISYIMLLDKPEVTWVNEAASDLYAELSQIFELDDRRDIVNHKTQVLMDITESFSNLTHAKRGTKLEWAIIILIVIEVILSLIDKIKW
ncbi:MAG: RMD1 family protein [Sporomusaceae bacterium]|nr:RMD1 family protein [Sporomusaceae bacterium]